ncbi:AMP-dependent synthetase/ligase [Desulfatirhabdium butyrativorans]|uniref:AMP-dependent synthetase/ligase n=1 Tax=Desulfatirhabdium butyrativorans TaxID=340467 RepID=UPI000409BA78|nr:long-chain fatty acid--CoA ligase [Desulfatirhabdium butyrativorans]
MEKTINEVFRNRCERYKDRLAVEKKRGGVWHGATWRQYYERASAVGLAFRDMGIVKGDRIAILSENRLEWLYTDMGTLGIGAVLVPVYPTLTAEDVHHLLKDSGSRIFVVENEEQLRKALTVWDRLPALERVIVCDPCPSAADNPRIMTFDALLEKGAVLRNASPEAFSVMAGEVEPSDLATIVYTSGTTGLPKGAMITHENIMAVVLSLDAIHPKFANDTDQAVPFLPLTHVFERAAGHFYGMYVGITSSYAESINTLLADFAERKPTIILAVPRVCEKVYQKILLQVQSQPKWKQKIFHWGHDIGLRISALREAHQPIPPLLKWQYDVAYRMIFQKLRDNLGGRVRWMTASGAPTSRDIILFFNASGITVIEGYGMTECFAPATMSHLDDYKIGTVGKAIPGVSIRIAEDGEILIKGKNVFKGYWNLPEETAAVFTEDGWLRSGDIGVLDQEGFLTITDRKKHLIITSGGKNVAPQKIENLFLSDPLFQHVIVIGERRKFLSALIGIQLDQAAHLARARGIAFGKPADLLDNPAFLQIVEEHVQERNTHLARFETIKKYHILRQELSQETGELTPSMKLKRNVIFKKYEREIEAMYAE